MRRLTTTLCTALMLLSAPAVQTATASDSFTANRTDFRDESIYFVITTRFYDGDSGNNVLCWDNQEQQKSTKDPCWRGDFQGIIDKLDYIKALGFTAIWITPVVQNASGYDYHGYHAMDFTKVDCRYQSSDGTKSGDVMFRNSLTKHTPRVSRLSSTSCLTIPATSVRKTSASSLNATRSCATRHTSTPA